MTEKVKRKGESKHIEEGYLQRALAGINIQDGNVDGHFFVRGLFDPGSVLDCSGHNQQQ